MVTAEVEVRRRQGSLIAGVLFGLGWFIFIDSIVHFNGECCHHTTRAVQCGPQYKHKQFCGCFRALLNSAAHQHAAVCSDPLHFQTAMQRVGTASITVTRATGA